MTMMTMAILRASVRVTRTNSVTRSSSTSNTTRRGRVGGEDPKRARSHRMERRALLLLLLLGTMLTLSVDAWMPSSMRIGRHCNSRVVPLDVFVEFRTNPLLAFSGDEMEDDGWDEDDTTGSSVPTTTTSTTNEESRAVSESLPSKATTPVASRSTSRNNEPERDLFIPIFTLVSVVGFGGLYAYETLRLYFNGELYLPGGN